MKTIWIIANWKSNKTTQEALEWISIVGPKLEKRENLKVVVCPTASSLQEVKKAVMVGNYPIIVGSQNLSPFDVGSYTGEEPAAILKEFVELSILGHSERRNNFHEDDEMVSLKVTQAKNQGIIPLVCVQGSDTAVPETVNLIAYEPVFAIGTGNPDTPENADSVAKGFINGDQTVLYGGSVNPGNVRSFVEMENISGVLIGKASLDSDEFLKIIDEVKSL